MTFATDAGFIIGNKYKVICDKGHSYTKNGDVLVFSRDDGSTCPWFISECKGSIACNLDRLEPIQKLKFKIGDKIIALKSGSNYEIGDILTVSDITPYWVYVNGDKESSGNGQPLGRFKLYVEPVIQAEIVQPNTDFSIDQIGGATTLRVQRELTSAELQALVKILKNG